MEWPTAEFMEGKKKSFFSNYYVTRLDWGLGKHIESIRFTMSNGDVSPKYGTKAFTHSCELDSPITKIKAKIKENRLVGLIISTQRLGECLTIYPEHQNYTSQATVFLKEEESILGFSMKVQDDKLYGLSVRVLTTQEIFDAQNRTR